MKSHEVRQLLEELRPLGMSADIEQLYPVLNAAPDATFASVAKKLQKIAPSSDAAEPDIGQQIARELERWAPLLRTYAKPAIFKDFDLLIATLNGTRLTGMRLDAWVRALFPRPREQPNADPVRVSKYLAELEGALGVEESFAAVFDRLKGDTTLSKVDWLDLGKRFAGTTVKSKSDSLKKIWARHHDLLVLQAKSESRDGRSAA